MGEGIEPDCVFRRRGCVHGKRYSGFSRRGRAVSPAVRLSAGNVYELHGSVHRNTCQKCGARYTLAQMLTLGDVPKCPKCGGRVKPDVVLYEEGLDPLTISGALDAIRRADLLIVAGTSLTVYPAAAFLDEYPGNRLVLINKTATPRDDIANLALHEKLGEVFQNL